MKTTGGIELDINKSDLTIEECGFRFYFTSLFNQKRFKEGFQEYINTENLKFKIKYKVNVDLTKVFLLSFYKRIEKRGFKVYNIYGECYISENEKFF